MPLVTYYGPELHPTELEVVHQQEDQFGQLLDLARPGTTEVIVTGVPLSIEPAVGFAVSLDPLPAPAAKPKKLTKKEQEAADKAAAAAEKEAADKAAAAEKEAADKAAAEKLDAENLLLTNDPPLAP